MCHGRLVAHTVCFCDPDHRRSPHVRPLSSTCIWCIGRPWRSSVGERLLNHLCLLCLIIPYSVATDAILIWFLKITITYQHWRCLLVSPKQSLAPHVDAVDLEKRVKWQPRLFLSRSPCNHIGEKSQKYFLFVQELRSNPVTSQFSRLCSVKNCSVLWYSWSTCVLI